ncbi:recombinase family protein [Phenylobacterium sp. LjRoot225]|uniref:recombinase family protein n=1 Tax=Phenylobacterium sp. LjRoot225 TaxID=3342285 RepID=UPI003ED0775E
MEPSAPMPAAQYLRMSTEQQCYSLRNQSDAIASYAKANGYEIKRTFQDAARSGLHLKGRAGLQALLAEVLREDRTFSAILVLDVTRWGRFQDLDQGAHYEFICRAAGVPVIYCVEPFENDGSTKAALIKQLKRLMAAEYSRELSAKTKAGQLLRARLGHRQGAPLIYGVRRIMVDRTGRPVGELRRGCWKAQHDNHVRLSPGPDTEVQVVRWIFRRFLCHGCTASSVARELNAQGVPFIGARRWAPDSLTRLLRHELMVGIYVYNRTSHPLKGTLVRNPADAWVRVQVFEPIIPRKLFAQVQEKLREEARPRRSREELLSALRALLRKHGRLSAALIKQSRDTPCVGVYAKHFGRLTAAYKALGYEPASSSRRKSLAAAQGQNVSA